MVAGTRVGSSTLTQTATHFDGGFASDGIFPYMASNWWMAVVGQEDVTDAVWTLAMQRCAWVDNAAYLALGLSAGSWPLVPDKPVRNAIFRFCCSLANATLPPSD